MKGSTIFFLDGRPSNPVIQCLPLLTLFSCMTAGAATVVNDNVTIDNGAPIEDWALSQSSTLTVNNAQTLLIRADNSTVNLNAGSSAQQIIANNGSQVNLDGALVNGVGGFSAVELTASSGTINASTLTGSATGLSAVRVVNTQVGSTVNVSGNSTISGVNRGAFATSHSVLNFTDSHVEGTGAAAVGLNLQSATATARSTTLVGGQNGVLIGLDSDFEPATLTLIDSTVQGRSGAALVVDFENDGPSTANISLTNSSLLAGNGTLLDVRGGADATMTVNASALTGDIVTEAGSTTNLTLQNGSLLTGRLQNVANATINDSSQWTLVSNSEVGNLTLNGGTVKFGDPSAFYQLNVTNLAGSGRFDMATDFATGQTDLLNVTGTASGNHALLIASSGTEPASGQPIRVVQTAGGDAQFSLLNGPVDLGAFSYGLAKTGNDWVLDPGSRTVSPGARSVIALFNTAPTVWYGELTSLRTRMGELRFNGGQSGAWGRAYGNKYNVADGSGVGYQQTQQGFTLGADAPLPLGDGQWLVGVLGGHSRSDLDLKAGTSGTVSSYYLGTYATWLDADTGYYLDGVLKVNRLRNDAKVRLSDGKRAKGDYDNTGVGGSIEFGRHINLSDGYFVEPFTQWSAVVIEGKDFTLDNGLQAEGDRTRSLLGKAGATVGRNFKLDNDVLVQPYVRAAWAHEFAKNNEVRVNNNVFNNDLSGSRGELAIGLAVGVTEKLQVHADFDYSNGKHIEQPFGANVGLRYSW